MRYRFLPHTADVKFQAFGKSLDEAFENSALALKEVIAGKIKIKAKITKKIQVKGKDNCALLYNFLEEFLFLLDAEEFLVSKIRSIEVGDGKISCVVSGDKAENYVFTNDVKAITYNEMVIGEGHGKYFCEVVLDV